MKIEISVSYFYEETIIEVQDYPSNLGFIKRLEIVLKDIGYYVEVDVACEIATIKVNNKIHQEEFDALIEEQFNPEVINIKYK